MSKLFKLIPYVAIVALGILLYFKWNQPTKYVVQSPMKTVAEVAKRYKDESGANHAVIDKNANTITVKEMDDPGKVPGYVDTASRALGIAKNEIDQITKLLFASEAKRLAAEAVIDSLGVASYSYNGKYISITWKRENSEKFPNGYFDYRYIAGLDIVDYTKTKKFLGMTIAKQSFTDFSLPDSNAYIYDGVKRLTVDRRQKQPWLSIQAGYEYNLQQNTHGYGPGLKFQKGLFELQARQLYWPAVKTWQTTFNANITLKNIF